MNDSPLVSIICTTYNHEAYIKDALEGFVMQKTDFPFEVIVHDDASTDRTAEIIKKFEACYSDLFVTIYQSENQYSRKDVNIWSDITFPMARGKYIAICEGDDYWIDPLKLQKQVDFLELNQNYGMIHTNCQVVDANNKDLQKYNRNWTSGDVFDQLVNGKYGIVTATVVFRTQMYSNIESELDNLNFKIGDLPMWIEFSRMSKVKYIDEITTCYRKLDNSASHSDDILKVQRFHENVLEIKSFYCEKYKLKFNHNYALSELYGVMIKECYNKNNSSSVMDYYKKMVNSEFKSIFRPIPLLFMLGTKYLIFDKLIKALYYFNNKSLK